MIASSEKASTSLPETCNALTVGNAQSVTCIDGKKPQLIKIRSVEHAQHYVVALGVCLSITRDYFVDLIAVVISDRSKMIA